MNRYFCAAPIPCVGLPPLVRIGNRHPARQGANERLPPSSPPAAGDAAQSRRTGIPIRRASQRANRQTVAMEVVDVWRELPLLRCQIADRVEAMHEGGWDSPSWCGEWRVRDVLGHLVYLAEANQMSVGRDVIRSGLRPDRALNRMATRLGNLPVPQLAARLRAASNGRFHVLGSPPAVALGEGLVHGSDALRPLGLDVDAQPAIACPVLDAYWRIGRLAFHAAPQQGRRLVATDLDWSRGKGPEIRGRAIDLLLFLANRPQVFGLLEGPGLSGL